MQTNKMKMLVYSSHCCYCKLVKYSSKLFNNISLHKDGQQLDSTITDVPLQAVGVDKNWRAWLEPISHIKLSCPVTSYDTAILSAL